MLEEMILLEETNEYLKFKVENLRISKMIDILVESGQFEELHLVELEILFYCLKNLYPDDKGNLKGIINIINEFFDKQTYLEIEWNYLDFFKQISNLKDKINIEKKINGEIVAYKGSFHSDFDIKIS